jgi:MFS superfamily sulfate permease-like transporter
METMQKTYTVRSLKNRKKNLQTVSFEGDLSLTNSVSLHRKVKSLNIETKQVKVRLVNVEKMDVTFIQILYALKAKLEGEGVTVEVESTLPAEIENIMHNSGFREIVSKQ